MNNGNIQLLILQLFGNVVAAVQVVKGDGKLMDFE
jgi:hypothetical protein